jgi:hypothetical protein
MTEVADYRVISDAQFTLPDVNGVEHKDFTFDLPADAVDLPREVLSWVMVGGSMPGAAKYSFTLNGVQLAPERVTPSDRNRTIHEVIGKDVKLNSGANTLTVAKAGGLASATLEMSDIVLWFHRKV